MKQVDSIRHSRLAAVEGMGDEGVARLNEGKVFVIGCGALGSLCAMYLAASGVGTVGIADFDTIDISNLQRQLFFDEMTLGQPKCAVLASKMRAINSDIRVVECPGMINEKMAAGIFAGYDFIIDGSDNPATKLMTARVCESIDKPYCIGGVREMSGQAMSWSPGHAGYAEIFGDTAPCSGFTPCSVGGVLGPAAGIVASVQAAEALKYLSGAGQNLFDRLLTFDLRDTAAQVLGF